MRLKKITTLLLALQLIVPLTLADTIIGKLYFSTDVNPYIERAGDRKVFSLVATDEIIQYVRSIPNVSKSYLLFHGDINDEQSALKINKTPRLLSGHLKTSGTLRYSNKSQGFYLETDKEEIDVVFSPGKKTSGYSFDNLSKAFYIDREVTVLIDQGNGQNVITAIIPADIYTADTSRQIAPQGVHKQFEKGKRKYLLDILPEKKHSQSHHSFSAVYEFLNWRTVKPGDPALIITYSGRQGDSVLSAPGHFALGRAIVNSDLSLDGEIHNFYSTNNKKNIVAGHTSLEDYFGGITTGQTNYRPTYSLIIYGVDSGKLDTIREKMDNVFQHLHSPQSKRFGISYNCVTESWYALDAINAHPGNQQATDAPYLPDVDSSFDQILYFFSNGAELFSPRNAFSYLFKNIFQIRRDALPEIFRIDFIFHAQLPSSRPRGGAAIDDFAEMISYKRLRGRIKGGESVSRDEIRSFLESID